MRKFVYGPGIDEPILMIDVIDSSTVYYYHFDGLGSVMALSNVNGEVVESYSYDVFGEPTIYDSNGNSISDSAIDNPYMFTGRKLDTETDNYYYRARYYNTDIGRFLQTDPVGYVAGWNLYTYVDNNPINYLDPQGLSKDAGPCGGKKGAWPYYKCLATCMGFPVGIELSAIAAEKAAEELIKGAIGKCVSKAIAIVALPMFIIETVHCTHKCIKCLP